jgi:hypothetical protein
VGSSFDESLVKFRQFLNKNDYPQKVVWVTPQDILLSGGRLIYVKVPVPETNEKHTRQMFALSLNSQRGILFGTICEIEDTTFAYAWLPSDAAEAKRSLMDNALKMSVRIGASKVPGETVRSLLRWSYLRLKLWRRQRQRNQMFC